MAQAGATCRHQIAKCVQEPSIRVPPVPPAGEQVSMRDGCSSFQVPQVLLASEHAGLEQ